MEKFVLLKVRGEKIIANSKLMIEGRLDADEFLNRIVYQQSTDDYGMLDVTLVNVHLDQDEEEEFDGEEIERIPSPTPSSQSSCSSKSVGQCALCDSEPELVLLPCFDYCVCEKCWEILKNNQTEPTCPNCKAFVKSAKRINFFNA